MTVLMARPQVVWNGTQQEGLELVNAIANNCGCEFGLMGIRLKTCNPHDALAHSQRFLDGLLWMRHERDVLLSEEWCGVYDPDGGWALPKEQE